MTGPRATGTDAAGAVHELRINRVHYPVTALGYGTRLGIWVQGCPLACRGCMARDTWMPDAGTGVPVPELAELWRRAARSGADGITISGGEPLAQPEALTCLLTEADAIRAELGRQDAAAGRPCRDLDILVYTGYEPTEFTPEQRRAVADADVLITGRFDITAPTGLVWRGSANQEMVLRTALGQKRYADMVDHAPARTPMQTSVTDDGIWLIGVPRTGGVRALERGLLQRGVRLSSASWRTASEIAHPGSGPGHIRGRIR
jgi:anaerobic ribonucleoside-triphosphate reductase activating protein